MSETDQPEGASTRWRRLGHSLGAKLTIVLLAAMVVIFSALGYLNIRLHRQHLEAATQKSAERVSDVIKRSTSYYMLRNDREALYTTIQTYAKEPGMEKVRIFDREGRISFSTDVSSLAGVPGSTWSSWTASASSTARGSSSCTIC